MVFFASMYRLILQMLQRSGSTVEGPLLFGETVLVVLCEIEKFENWWKMYNIHKWIQFYAGHH